MTDKINPDHYKIGTPYEVRVVIEQYGWDKDHCLASAFEYMVRAGHKAGESEADDLRKAVWNLQRKIDRLDEVMLQEQTTYVEKYRDEAEAGSIKRKCANVTHKERVLVARAAHKAGKRENALIQHVARRCNIKWGAAAAVCRELGFVRGRQ